MQAKKLERLLDQQTSTAKKVYTAVPIHEMWPVRHIHSELVRQGTPVADNILRGCLNSLTDDGVIKEVAPGMYARVVPRTPNPPKLVTGGPPMGATPTPAYDPMQDLAELGARARQLAEDVESAALRVQEYLEKREASVAKLRQLSTLLKEID